MKSTPGKILKAMLVLVAVMYFQKVQPLYLHDYVKSETTKPDSLVYKVIDTTQLVLEFSYPEHISEGKQYPAIIFFFGGGWNGGSTDQFKPHAAFFAERGMIGIVADYRVKKRQGTTPFEAVKDAKSAIRFLREHAKELQIDPDRIVASGGSAGGHLAAAAGIVPGLEEENENLGVSSKPNALVLFNPVFDNGPDGFGYDRIGDRYPEISPLHNITVGAPPAIVFLGTNDHLIPVSTAEKFKVRMEEEGSRCDLFLYEGQPHGFFNYKYPEYYSKTILEAARFLESIGYIRNPDYSNYDPPATGMLSEAVVKFTLACEQPEQQSDLFGQPERGFTSTQPAANWQHGLLTGNGTTGAIIRGEPYDETITLSHEALYLPYEKTERYMEMASHIREIQHLCIPVG
jgi:acetyl esterase